jgi:hypothetical protein
MVRYQVAACDPAPPPCGAGRLPGESAVCYIELLLGLQISVRLQTDVALRCRKEIGKEIRKIKKL